MEMKRRDDFRLTRNLLILALLALLLVTLLRWDNNRDLYISTQILSQHNQSTNSDIKADEQNPDPAMREEETKQATNHNVDDSETSVETQVCNYAKGRWFPDNRPLYYHVGCKYIMRKWKCRLFNRTDFSYENYRWQSIDCKIPDFDPPVFLKRMQDKTVAFIGDSLSRTQFQSLMCMLTGGEDSPDVEDLAEKYGFLQIRPHGIHYHGWAYRFRSTNTTILHSWSARLCDEQRVNATDPKSLNAMHLDRPPPFIQQNIDQFNGVLVINTRNHWNKQLVNLDLVYLNGTPVDGDLRNVENARAFTANNIVKWLDSKMAANPSLQVFFRTASPKHFIRGEWNTGGHCDNTVPMTRGSEVFEDESRDKAVADAVKGSRVKILDITGLSDLRDEAHISHFGLKPNDCIHWCLPGVPDTWNELLNAQLLG